MVQRTQHDRKAAAQKEEENRSAAADAARS
jgi:hypothetical protein